jgi:hypothetical protein
MLEKNPGTAKPQRGKSDADAKSAVIDKHWPNICADCKWFKKAQPVVDADTICVNPLNFQTYNYFNPSTGDVVKNIICAPQVLFDGTCNHWEKGE